MKIILGSQSKGRKRVMEEMGFQFEVMSSDIDEKAIRHDDPKILTMTLAHAKADVILPKIKEEAILITTDTVVVCNGKVLEKPEDENEAREFLRSYAVYPVEIITSVVVTNTAIKKQVEGTGSATIYFYPIPEEVIDQLIAEKEIFNLAGAFDIFGVFEKYIQKIEGERESIIGLPKALTLKLIEEVKKT
jgi:septum formation protein